MFKSTVQHKEGEDDGQAYHINGRLTGLQQLLPGRLSRTCHNMIPTRNLASAIRFERLRWQHIRTTHGQCPTRAEVTWAAEINSFLR
jgi:hypothetical protein